MADSLRLDGAALKLVDCSEVNVNKVVSGANCESINGNAEKCSGPNKPFPAIDTKLSNTIMSDGLVTNSVAVLPNAMGQSASTELPILSPPSTTSNLLLSSTSSSLSSRLSTMPTSLTMTTPSSTGSAISGVLTNTAMVPVMATVLPIRKSIEHESKPNASNVPATTTAMTPVPIKVVSDRKIIDNACERNSISVQHVGLTMNDAKALLPPPPPIPAMDLQDIEDLRKKRCADRYDSSESSDSGVATLSCTDSSAASSEDTSDPGSPYSPSSCDDTQQRLSLVNKSTTTLTQRSPDENTQQSTEQQQSNAIRNNADVSNKSTDIHSLAPPHAWPWNLNGTAMPTQTTPLTTPVTKTAKNISNKAKRVSTSTASSCAVKKTRPNTVVANGNHINGANNGKGINSSTTTTTTTNNVSTSPAIMDGAFAALKPVSIVEAVKSNVDSNSKSKLAASFPTQTHIYNPQTMGAQTKITGFFKSQMKPLQTATKKDLTNMVIRSTDFAPKSSSKKLSNHLSKASLLETFKSNPKTNNDLDVRALTSITSPMVRKVERKTAKVAPLAPISRKPTVNTVSKKPLQPVLPKKPVNIAPRTAEVTNSKNNLQMISPAKCAEMQKAIALQPKMHQSTVLLTAIRIPPAPPNQPKTMQQSKNSTKIGGPMYQLAPTPVMPKLVQIPNIVTPKEASTSSHNLMLNNGAAHYFLNGAVIKLQQMATQQQLATQQHMASALDAVNNMLQKGQGASFMAKQMTLADQSGKDVQKMPEPMNDQNHASHHLQNKQMAHHHQQLAQSFAASAATGPHFAQPVFMATSNGLLLTAALPTVMTSHLPNLQSINQTHQQQSLSALHHQFNQQPHPASNNILPNMHATTFVSPSANFPFVPMTTTNGPPPQMVSSNHHPSAPTIINIPSSITQPLPLPPPLSKPMTSIAQIAPMPPIASTALGLPKTSTSITVSSSNSILISTTPITSTTLTPTSVVNAQPVEIPLTLSNGLHHMRSPASVTVTVKTIPTAEPIAVPNKSTSDIIPVAIPKIAIATAATIPSPPSTPTLPTPPSPSPPSPSLQTLPCRPSLPSEDPNGFQLLTRPCLPSPKSILLEKIQQKKPDNGTMESFDESSQLKSEKMLNVLRPPAAIDTDLSNAELPECSKSPILSQPKTIRFPARDFRNGAHRSDGRAVGTCYWDSCNAKCETSSNLIDHLQTQHVNTQTGPFTCRWANCKVHGRESCSRKWLERHVLSHGGSKFFKCIFDKCRQRFSSHIALQKHVNVHINSTENNKDSTVRRVSDVPVSKKLRVNGKKLRYRRQPFSARMFDFFDGGIMEGLQHRLEHTGTIANGPNGSINFKGTSVAKRVTATGNVEYLIRWSPGDIIPDEWLPANKAVLTKTVRIHTLSQPERISLLQHLKLDDHPTTIFSSASSLKSLSSSSSSSSSSEHASSLLSFNNSSVASLATFDALMPPIKRHHRKTRKLLMPS